MMAYDVTKIPHYCIMVVFQRNISERVIIILVIVHSYYIYHLFEFVSGPHSIHQRNPLNIIFPTWVGKIDAVFTWSRDGRVYIFVHKYYWRYDIKTKRFDYGYPRRNRWKGKDDAAYSNTRNPIFIMDNSINIMDNW